MAGSKDDTFIDQVPSSSRTNGSLVPNDGPVHPPGPSGLSRVFNWFWSSCTAVSLTAAVVFAGANLAFKELSDKFPFYQVIMAWALISLPIWVPVGYVRHGVIFVSKDDFWVVFWRAFFIAMAIPLYGISLTLLPISEAALLGNSLPVVAAVIQWFCRAEPFDRWIALGVAGTVIGQTMIARPPFIFGNDNKEWDTDRVVGIMCAIVSNIVRAISYLIVQHIDERVPTIVTSNYGVFATFIVALVALPIGYPKGARLDISIFDVLLFVGIASETFNQVLILRSFEIGSAIKASVLSLSRMLMIMALGFLVRSDDITIWHAIGTVILISSIILVIYRQNRSRPKEKKEKIEEKEVEMA